MAIRIPFFGALTQSSPLSGLLEHYEQIAKGMTLIEEALECYISSGSDVTCKDFILLLEEVNAVEEHADTIKRYIRNHLPRGLFLPVEKHLFFTYTRAQDDILDAGQDCLQWLSIRPMEIPDELQKSMVFYISAVSQCIKLLKPALDNTLAWLGGGVVERTDLKVNFRNIRNQHKEVTALKHQLIRTIFCSELEFKTTYQLIHFIEDLHRMSHSSEGCADLLRVMIAK